MDLIKLRRQFDDGVRQVDSLNLLINFYSRKSFINDFVKYR